MINYDLPKNLEIDGTEHPIRSDFRAILDINVALQDLTLSDIEKIYVVLNILYVDCGQIENQEEALKQAMIFINGGDLCKNVNNDKEQPKLFDWEQDFLLILAPINRMLGLDIRTLEYLHWWTFLLYFQEIGECLFSSVLTIRDKTNRGKKLEKHEEKFCLNNFHLIAFKSKNKSDWQQRQWKFKKVV